MREFDIEEGEGPRFSELAGRIGFADQYREAVHRIVAGIRDGMLDDKTQRTLGMLLSELGENLEEAMRLEKELVALHAPDQVIPGPDTSEPLIKAAQWDEYVKREGLPF